MAAAVATVAGLAMSRETDAANNGPLLMGVATNSATLTTTLTGGSTLKVVDGTTDGNGAVKASIYGRSTISGNAGVLGESVTTEGGRGVWGRNASDVGVGVYGSNNSSGGIGVYGESTDTGNSDGVVGKSSGGNGVVGRGTLADFFADGNGRIVLNKAGIATPAAGATPIGTIGRDAASNLWYTPASGQYRKLAGPGTAGAFHAIAPVRVYDSRSALPTPGKLVTGDSRVVSVKDGRNQDTGVVTAADAIPAGATAVAYNITVTQTETGGYLSVVPGDATAQSGSVINWFGTNQDLANGLIGKLDGSRQFKVFTGGAGATHFVIDVSGYFL